MLKELCDKALVEKGLDDEKHRARLALEMRDIDSQNEHGYFLDLYEKKTRYPVNQNNLLVPYLLDIVDHFDINKEPVTVFGDFPDADLDYVREVRDYLKNEWAPKEFGADKVCSIGSYNAFGIKSSLVNMARVYGENHHEIQALTKKLGLKDEDNKALTFKKALELYPELKAYCEKYPLVAEAAEKLVGRNNSMGKHAGGLIVSGVPINNFVPLVKDKEGIIVSAWTEGLKSQDLGPVGLIKFDLLVIKIIQVAEACRLVKERHKLDSICALPGRSDWSDISYLNDPKALAMANKGDLLGIFQFDSPGIRKIVKEGGVDSFDDLTAYSALWRPAALGMKMQERYIKRKKGEESYSIPPLLEPVLGKTYNVMLFQEQTMQILNLVGDIPLKDCEILRKAISKKNEAYFAKYKEMFIVNGQKNLNCDREYVENLWRQIELWSSYGFNKTHSVSYTYFSARLLWLKAHYPLEFYTAILSCEDDIPKIKEYKQDALRHGVKVEPVDLNKSGVKFTIVGNTLDLEKDYIVYGFAKLKGIGEEIAKQVVSGQPYNNLLDFMERFGTDKAVLERLIGLRSFGDPIYAWKHYTWFNEKKKSRMSAAKRFEANCIEKQEELRAMLPPDWHDLAVFSDEALSQIKTLNEEEGQLTEEEIECIENLHVRYHKAVENRSRKIEEYKQELPEFLNFHPDRVEIEQEQADFLLNLEEVERRFYGFLWIHPLEKSPDFSGDMTFDNFRSEELLVGSVEVFINSADLTTAKSGKTQYWLLGVEDATGETQQVQVWMDDWNIFKDDLQPNNMVKIKLSAPSGGFSRYTLFSPPRHQRWKLPKDKSLDCRVCVMRKP